MRILHGTLAAMLGLGLGAGLTLAAAPARATAPARAAAPARVTTLPADGGSHRSPHTSRLTHAGATASMIMCAKVAAKAGFSFTRTVATSLGPQPQVVIAIAVAMAESGCSPNAVNINAGGSRDRGLWQMNTVYHPEVSNACAFQIQCNANAAWNTSDHGANWKPWSTFTSGAWQPYLADAKAAISGGFTFQLISAGGGTCLDADTSAADGAPIRQWACNSSDGYQQWTVVSATVGAPPILRNVGAGTCLSWDGTIAQANCNAADANQQFSFLGSGKRNTDGQAQALMQNAHVGTCVDADSTTQANGAPIRQGTCNAGDSSQMWD